jgi:putative peptidoglycan lipid II flippase
MNLLRTLAAISSMTMLSRITGLLRESLFARAFGQSAYTDAFIVAFRIPNLLRRLFAEGAFSQAFVPILSEYKTQHGEAATKGLVDHVATALVWATVLVSVVGIVASPVLLWMIAGGLERNPAAFDASVLMTRMMFPYIACMSFVALAGGVLNTWRQFKIPAFTPVLLNLSFIFAALVLVRYLQQPIYAMAIAVCVGGVLQVAIQVPALMRIGMLPRISMNPFAGLADPGVRRMLQKMGPAVFAVSAAQISLLINTSIAARLGEGSVSALQYADRLMEFPTALLGVALGTILLPNLSKASAEGDTGEYSSLLDWGLRLTFLLALPAAVGMAAMSEALIATPVRIAVGVLVATQAMNLVFVPLLGVAGLALSIGLGACLNAGFLYTGLRRRGIYAPRAGWIGFFARLAVAVLVMGAVAWACQAQVDWAAMRAHPWLRAGALLGIIAASGITYFAVLAVLGFRLADIKRRAK